MISVISKIIGNFLYYFLTDRKKVAEYNISKILPDIDNHRKKYLIINSFSTLIENFLILIKIQKYPKEKIDKIFIVKGLELLDKAISKAKGVILVTGHFGNWELPVVLPLYIPYEYITIAKSQKPKILNDFLFKIRSNFGMKIVESKSALLPIFKTLKRKGIVGFIIDQRTKKKESAEIEFMGEKIYCTKAPAYFALKTGAPVLFCYSKKIDGVNYFIFDEEIPLNRRINDKNFEDIIQENTQLIHDKIKDNILKNPENWYWLHSKFKSRRRVLQEKKKSGT